MPEGDPIEVTGRAIRCPQLRTPSRQPTKFWAHVDNTTPAPQLQRGNDLRMFITQDPPLCGFAWLEPCSSTRLILLELSCGQYRAEFRLPAPPSGSTNRCFSAGERGSRESSRLPGLLPCCGALLWRGVAMVCVEMLTQLVCVVLAGAEVASAGVAQSTPSLRMRAASTICACSVWRSLSVVLVCACCDAC
jgi:hypothetical protein